MSKTSLSDWQEQQYQDPDFLEECRRLDLGYQITRLRLLHGMTQAELAVTMGTRQSYITRLENGTSMPSLSFLERIADALDAQVEIKIIPRAIQVE